MSSRLRAYRFALDATACQRAAFERHAGAARWAYNHALAEKKHAHYTRWLAIGELVTLGWSEQQAKKQLTVTVPTKGTIHKRWTRRKGDDRTGSAGLSPWWHEVSTYAFQSAWDDCDQAWKNWMSSITGNRAGPSVGEPQFKRKGRARDSFRLHHDVKKPTIRLDSYRRLRMPRLGSVRLHESAKRLSRALDRGGVIQSVTVARGGKRWYASVLVDEPDTTPGRETQGGAGPGQPPGPSDRQKNAGRVGVDLGVSHLAALSTGDTISNPRHLRRAEQRLTQAQRELSRKQGPDRRTGQKPSNGWRKARAKLARLHHQVAEQRDTYLHQVTKHLTTTYDTVAIEDLHVAGMTGTARGTEDNPGSNVRAKAGLNRSILDVAPGEFRRQVEYKTRWYGSQVAVCDRWFPSSKTCSSCGAVKPTLALDERTYQCGCGLVLDRDVNAARNIAAAAVVAPGAGPTLNASPQSSPPGEDEDGRPGG